MILFKRVRDMRSYLNRKQAASQAVGFVPTMGALHEGHISLIRASREAAGITVCSIFVNPTQFNDPADFEKYPVSREDDIRLLEGAGCDVLFLPEVADIYPPDDPLPQHYNIGYLETVLEGKYRPGHFQGVCQVMDRLLRAVSPDHLFLGQKDWQQCQVIRKLLDITGNQERIAVHLQPTLREPDGLAMSSRNRRLRDDERTRAAGLYQALLFLREKFGKSTAGSLRDQATQLLQAQSFRTDYVAIADPETLQPIPDDAADRRPAVALMAAFMGEVRLIDNMILS